MTLPTQQNILDDLAFFDDWEQRYQYIIDLGKSLPALPEQLKTEALLVKGCQSSVWLSARFSNDVLTFEAASDAIIVNGLVAIVLAAYQHQTPAAILAFDIDRYLKTLDLERHISQTRGNGLRAIVSKIKAIAKSYA